MLEKSQKGVVLQPQPPSRFATYDKTVTEAGKKDTSTWSKIGGFLKRTAVAGLDWVNEQRRENEIANFKMRQMMYSDRNDPMRFVEGEDGKRRMTNNALEAFENAKTDEERMAIIAEDTKEIPLIRAINSDLGKKITGTVSDKTENLPIKTLARFIAIGDSTYEEARDAMIASADATIADEETSRWKKWLLQVEKGGAQSLLGVVLSVGSSLATRNPTVGTTVGTGYFGALSIEEERQKYEGGNIDSTSALGNIAIDTIGDQVLGGLAESTLKSLATDAGKSWLKNAAKGFLVEGGTESAQSLLKYANDYTAASTDADRDAIAASFTEYIKSGGIVDEFMVGGITGGIVNTLATAAGGATRPYVNVKGEDLEPEKVAQTKDKIEEAVDKALDSGDLSSVVETVQEELGASDDTAARIVQEVAQDIVAENANREAPVGSPEYVALQQDITSMVQSGINPADISISMQEQLNVSEAYATQIVADALARIETKVETGNQKLDALTEETRQQTQRYAYIANQLNERGVQVEENDPLVLALRVAISGKGTAQEKEAAINLLADPANEDTRAVYEEEMGAILPTDRNEAVEYLRARMNKSKERVYAEQMVQFQLDRAEAGRREMYGTHDATKDNSGINFVAIKSTFPTYIPEELRKRELLDKVQPYLDRGQRPKETEKQNRLARLYDAIQNEIDVQEARLMSEEVIVTSKTTAEGSDIPFQLAHDQIMSESQLSREEAEQIIRRYFTADEVPLAFVNSIRTPRGLEAWGKYSQGVITLVKNPKADTPHHESVHAFLDLFVSEQDRQKYLDAAYEDAVDRLGKDKVEAETKKLAKRYKDQLTDARVKAIYSEEALADGFYEYLQGREVRTTLQKLFDMIIDFIDSMRGEMTARKLYNDIINRKRDNVRDLSARQEEFFGSSNLFYSEGQARAMTTKLLKKLEGRSTVSKQFISDLTNSPDLKQVEKDLIRRVLETEGDKVDVALFAEKVVAELLPLDVKSSDVVNSQAEDQYAEDYMVNEGGFTPKYEGITLPAPIRGKVANYVENVYESPIKTEAGRAHFDWVTRNYFGHTRIEDMADGETRRVIEVQSDLYQKGNLDKELEDYKVGDVAFLKDGTSVTIDSSLQVDDSGYWYRTLEGGFVFENQLVSGKKKANILKQYNDPTAHFRMIREEIKRAAQDGKTTVLFPTGETAMKIEGLGQQGHQAWGSEELRARLSPENLKVGLEIQRIPTPQDFTPDVMDKWIITEVTGDGKFKAIQKRQISEAAINMLKKGKDRFDVPTVDSNNIANYAESFDISGKIDTNNPIYKFYEKEVSRYLKSKYGITETTDENGVSWYAVKVDPKAANEPVEAFSVMKNRIHNEDRQVMVEFIDFARIGTEMNDVRFEMAERLALKWGINLDKGLASVANEFEKILNDMRRVTGTILYSEKENTLLNVHNLTVQNLLFSNEFGGIVNPSIATIDLSKQGFDNYGEVTLVGDKNVLDLGKTYRADAYSPRFPRFEYPATYSQVEKIKADLNAENQAFAGEDVRIDEDNTYDQLLRTPAMVKRFIDANGIEVDIVEGFSDDSNIGKSTTYSFQVSATAEQLYDFGVYVRDYLDGFGVTPKIYSGRTPMGRPKYIDANRENVLKVMRKPDRGGETFNYGLGTIRAKLTPTLPKSQVAKNRDKIVTTEQFEKVRDEMQNRFFALAEEFGKYSKYKSDRLDMSSYDGLADYLAGTWNGFLNNYENVPQSLLDEVQKFKNDIREMPTEYFETKAKGVIDFGEFKYAIVPNNVSPRVTEILKRKGVEVLMYDAKKEEERTKIMASLGDVLFQENSSNEQVVFAFGKQYLNFNLEFMVEKADEKGINLFKLLVDRVDSQDNTPAKIAALQNILNHLTLGEALLPVRRTTRRDETPVEVVVTKTNATTAFKNLEIEGVPRATKANTETHEYKLGKEKIKIEDAELKKYRGDQDGVYVDGYAIFVKRDGKDFVAHVEPDLETASKWLSDHVGKTVTVPKRATSNVLVSGRVAHAVVTDKDLVELEANHIAGAKGITDFVFYDAQGNEIEKKVVYDKPQYVKATPELVAEATGNKKAITFPRYFAVVNRKLVQVTDDVAPATPSLLDQESAAVDESRVTRVEQDQPTQKPVKPTLVEKPKTKASKAFERAKSRLAEEFQEDLSYTRIRLDDQMAKAFELVDTNPAYAKAVALGLEQPPLDITDTAISLAVAERAKDEKNYALQADVEKARSLRQTRRGQEIVLERGRVDENSPEFFVRELIKRRKHLAEMKYKPVLTRIKPFMEMLDEKVAEKKKKGAAKVKSELEMKASELDAFLAEMAC